LFDPKVGEKIPLGTIGYFEARNKGLAHDLVISEFLESGITQAELARRLGKTPAQVNRLLGAPGNWTLDTFSVVLFAISGAQPKYSLAYPLKEHPRNYRGPEWLIANPEKPRGADNKIVQTQIATRLTTATVTSLNVSGAAITPLQG